MRRPGTNVRLQGGRGVEVGCRGRWGAEGGGVQREVGGGGMQTPTGYFDIGSFGGE
jgi:hypothetical protein